MNRVCNSCGNSVKEQDCVWSSQKKRYLNRCLLCERKRCKGFYSSNKPFFTARDSNLTEKRIARNKIKNAISRGVRQRLPCEVCGNVKTDAHHDDYSKPLDVRFLCRKHHAEVHRLITNPQDH